MIRCPWQVIASVIFSSLSRSAATSLGAHDSSPYAGAHLHTHTLTHPHQTQTPILTFSYTLTCRVYISSMSQKERSLGGHGVGHSKQKLYMFMCPIRTVSEMEIFHCTFPKLLIRKIYYVLFLIPVFIV